MIPANEKGKLRIQRKGAIKANNAKVNALILPGYLKGV